MLPKSQLSPELKKKNELLKKFQNLSEIKPNKRKLTRSVTPVVKKEKVELNIMKPKQFKNLIMRLELGNKKNFLNHNQFLNKKNKLLEMSLKPLKLQKKEVLWLGFLFRQTRPILKTFTNIDPVLRFLMKKIIIFVKKSRFLIEKSQSFLIESEKTV